MSTIEAATLPDNVPGHLAVDFDFYAPPGADEDVHLAWRRLREGPDIVWTPRNGGHWIATRAADIQAMQLDFEHFSHALFMLPRAANFMRSLPLSLDPPEQRPYRKLIMSAFLPKVINALEAQVRSVARDLVDDIAPRGACEFVGDFAKVLPIVVFLGMMDLPQEDRALLLPHAEVVVRSNSVDERMAAHHFMNTYLAGWLEKRAKSPGTDLISMITKADVDGRPFTPEEMVSVAQLLLAGGLDTVASMLGFIARFLAMNPAHRHQLLENPALIPNAVEELIRCHGLANTARVLTQDYAYNGVSFRKGDQIQLPNSLAGLDEALVDDPLTVDFTRARADIKHAAFGNGVHTCPGAVLARREITVFLEEWLPRIPDFEIKPGTKPLMASGMVNGVLDLQLIWKPAA